jgi:phosphoglycerate kinase
MLNKKTVRDVQVGGKRVLVRCDFNVPLDKEDPTKITSDKRIVESLKTINYLINAGARVILCSHIGKTGQGKTLAPVAKRLSELLDKEVPLLPDITSEATKEAVMALKDGDVVLLENTRKYEEEEANDPEFARKLASLGEIFVNDALGTAHRAHASTEGVTHY